MARLMLLVNPYASSVTPRGRVVVQRALKADHDVTVVHTAHRDDATDIARRAADDGFETVVVLGGDGTLNETANGLAGTDTALAALPGGSTNVFARTLGLPNDPLRAVAHVLEALGADRVATVGLGSVNDRLFLFHVGIGYDAAVVEQVERRGSLKRHIGHPLFIWSSVATWFRHYDHSRSRFSVTGDGGLSLDDGVFAVCLNSNPYTFLGPRAFNVVPDATLETPLALVTLRSLKLPTILGVAAAALGGRDGLKTGANVDVRRDLDHVVVDGHGPFPYQVDGDYLGEVDRLEFGHRPQALRVVMPGPALSTDTESRPEPDSANGLAPAEAPIA
ncbi:MAG: diacylglycerol/lipid kinase family protein [Acidimicrobiia bacterium]